MTSIIRDFGTGVETQGRALRSSVRHLVLSAGMSESSRVRIAREIQMSPGQLVLWISGALAVVTSLLNDPVDSEPTRNHMRGDFAIVEKSLTRC